MNGGRVRLGNGSLDALRATAVRHGCGNGGRDVLGETQTYKSVFSGRALRFVERFQHSIDACPRKKRREHYPRATGAPIPLKIPASCHAVHAYHIRPPTATGMWPCQLGEIVPWVRGCSTQIPRKRQEVQVIDRVAKVERGSRINSGSSSPGSDQGSCKVCR